MTRDELKKLNEALMLLNGCALDVFARTGRADLELDDCVAALRDRATRETKRIMGVLS